MIDEKQNILELAKKIRFTEVNSENVKEVLASSSKEPSHQRIHLTSCSMSGNKEDPHILDATFKK